MSARPARIQRLFVTQDLAEAGAVDCTRDQANYLLNVLRLRAGAEVLVFNGRDGEWRAVIADAGKRRCRLDIVARTRPQSAGPDVGYMFAPLKRARLDYMVQKATEMGVFRLSPVITRHTQVERVNLERMRANAIEAAEQCGILRLPEVDEPTRLADALARLEGTRHLVFCDELAEIADPVAALGHVAPGPVTVLIGPEGGFSDDERGLIRSSPAVTALSLGPRVMRADTAAVAALALVNAVLGDWRG